MKIQEVASKYEKYQVEMRRYFHQYPEVSEKEYETSKAIKAELDKMGSLGYHADWKQEFWER